MIGLTERPAQPERPEFATSAFLESRVREEADAAARASSVEATLAHVMLATRYAERLADCCGRSAASQSRSWVDAHRLW